MSYRFSQQRKTQHANDEGIDIVRAYKIKKCVIPFLSYSSVNVVVCKEFLIKITHNKLILSIYMILDMIKASILFYLTRLDYITERHKIVL